MSSTTVDSDDAVINSDQMDSPSIDGSGITGGNGGGIVVLKKGPWTSAEDEILADYVKKHGEGNWNAVQKHSGLLRCGKSCRLRWTNHLRPNLKKGSFTSEEERLIIQLHAKIGNKWARMATHLPGRTDNEIKNYWNTRFKRLQRSGLPLYPPDVCLQALPESQDIPNTDEVRGKDSQSHNILPDNFDVPDISFENYTVKLANFSDSSAFQDGISVNDTLIHCLEPNQHCTFMLPTAHTLKKMEEAIVHPTFSGVVFDELSPLVQFPAEDHEKIRHRSFGLGDSFALNPAPSNEDSPRVTCVTTGSHGPLSGNYSASEYPTGTVKQELPSFQYSVADDLSSWSNIYPPSPSFEAVDTYLQSPSQTAEMQSDPNSLLNSGLLEAVVYQARTLGCGKSNFSEEKSSSSIISPAEMTDSATLDVSETQCKYGDPISPLGRSVAKGFRECTCPVNGSTLDEATNDEAPLHLDDVIL